MPVHIAAGDPARSILPAGPGSRSVGGRESRCSSRRQIGGERARVVGRRSIRGRLEGVRRYWGGIYSPFPFLGLLGARNSKTARGCRKPRWGGESGEGVCYVPSAALMFKSKLSGKGRGCWYTCALQSSAWTLRCRMRIVGGYGAPSEGSVCVRGRRMREWETSANGL
jgi:hypothetical protein